MVDVTFVEIKTGNTYTKSLPVIKPYGYIYGIWDNLKNKIVYVGQSLYYHKRGKRIDLIKHYTNYFGSGLLISRAIRKNGKQRYTKLQIADAKNKLELDKLEKYYIDFYNTLNINDSDCLNISIGGNTIARSAGWHHDEKTKQKISQESKLHWSDSRYRNRMLEISKKCVNPGRFVKGHATWNTGKTKETSEKVKEAGRKISFKLKEHHKNKKLNQNKE